MIILMLAAAVSLLSGIVMGAAGMYAFSLARRIARYRPYESSSKATLVKDPEEILRLSVCRAIKDACKPPSAGDRVDLKRSLDRLQEISDWAVDIDDEEVRSQYLSWINYFRSEWQESFQPGYVSIEEKVAAAIALEIPRMV